MATENNNLPVRIFTPQYLRILSTVFAATKAFGGAFAPIQLLDGITHNEKAFSVKTCGTPVVIGTYDKGANTAFGTGTGNSSRFGDRTEIIYTDTDVPYDYDLVIHEGIDQVTVNNSLENAVADRLLLQSEAQVRFMNVKNGAFLSDSAALEKTLEGYTEDAIKTLFNAMSKYFVDKEVNAPVTAYLIADLYNAIVDMASVNMSKGSSISLDENGLLKYKGFTLVETPSQYFVEDEIAYFSPAGIVIPFVGIEIARTIESEDFAGVALQAFAKGGNFILDDNKAALAKVTTAAPSNYNVTVTPSQNGTVTSSAASAAAGATVTLTIAPDSNYQLGTITANDGAVTLSGTGNTRTFTMPAGNVTIAATFTST